MLFLTFFILLFWIVSNSVIYLSLTLNYLSTNTINLETSYLFYKIKSSILHGSPDN